MNSYLSSKFKQQSVLDKIRTCLLKESGKLMLGHSLSTDVTVTLHEIEMIQAMNQLREELESEKLFDDFMQESLHVSKCKLECVPNLKKGESKQGEIKIQIKIADGVECPRCWKYSITSHPEQLCQRCDTVIKMKQT